ncbi:MAG: L,D-transpeptidase family protein [Wujia sp.]
MNKRSCVQRVLCCLLFAVMLVSSLSAVPVLDTKAAGARPSVSYVVHAQSYGWMQTKKDGENAGTTGEGKRLEAIAIALDLNGVMAEDGTVMTGGLQYRVHAQSYGWMNWVDADANGATPQSLVNRHEYAGTMGQGKRLEAIQIKLTGKLAEEYEVFYRVHMQTYGWSPWTRDGQTAGTTGQGKRLEAIQIKLVDKADEEPGATISYSVHAQSYGWMNPVGNGQTAGTTGQGKRLEAIKVQLQTTGVTGGIEYSTHVQGYGWMKTVSDGTVSGTSGQAKRMEAIRISLTGDISAYYDIYYRVHCQSYGWLDWAKNGQAAGTESGGKRMEAIQIKLVKKGEAAPGKTNRPFVTVIPKNPTKDTYVIKINREACCVTIYRDGVPVKAMACSPGDATPTGTFSIGGQWRWNTLMGGVQGQYCSQISGNILFHSVLFTDRNPRTLITSSFNNLGKRVSHGCVRLRVVDAKWIFDNCPPGTKIIIYNSADPGPLGKPDYGTIPGGQTWDPSDPSL